MLRAARQMIASSPMTTVELTASKLLPEKHITCQLTKGGGGKEKTLQTV